MKDVMLDFETFGNGKNACVVQIGACYFDRKTGEIGKKFSINVDARDAVANGAVMDADTVYWWMRQSVEAQTSLQLGELAKERDAFTQLNSFLEDSKAIWSHATFDFVILTETLKRLGIKPSFHYRNARDLRTLVDIAKVSTKKPREGIHHNGLDDCIYQVSYTVEALNNLEALRRS